MPVPVLPLGWAQREAIAAGPDYEAGTNTPHWLRRAIENGNSPAELIELLRRRVPQQSNLREAQAVINEIGRLPGGAMLIKGLLTQKEFSELPREVR